ncbi:DUF362 domain-containing protein [Romboutsia sp. 1001216sp1]|uniref:DUF362 domain-containing protein n=1 Tax=unclassified Romboutsia TaxID=2626894 RepID=UPI00189E6442|nr:MULTISPECIES: DUF362 domain-containing protein [unclassified Romboutsia]MDB8791494.1 DUF362 domain-containing protein [Romboutsia sp. 1001216sp1]MDB8802485.1 DUF362 domain-containing protein [Romboutsia sp. 1001216sp1]MDB8813882.1 DUF362 domain-containing protein [Romboutsia sp. 1001216sp1]
MIRDRRVNEPIVAITKAMTESKSLEKALDLLPIDKIIKKGDVVVINPNWVKDSKPKDAGIVGPKTLKKLIQYIKEKEPSKIYIATGSGSKKTTEIMKNVGYDKIIEEEKVGFIDMNYGPYIDLKLKHDIIKSTPINEIVNKADVIISFTQLKHHEEATVTSAIKNIAMGWPPAEIHGYPKKNTGIHEDLHGFIRAMANEIPIDLSIISCDKAMVGTGPHNGMAVDTPGLIIASTDPLAADCIGARLLGFLPQAVCYLYGLDKDNIGESDPKNMEIKGLSLEEAEKIFSKCAYGDSEVRVDKEKLKDIHGR